MKKIFKIIGVLVCLLLINMIMTANYYNNNNVVKTITKNAEKSSRNCCAWYVMKALHSGYAFVPIARACDYKYILPLYGFYDVKADYYSDDNPNVSFEEFKNRYKPLKGDIAVFPNVKGHIFGHIAIYNGKQWVSDFKQKHFIVASAYKDCEYMIYRMENVNSTY